MTDAYKCDVCGEYNESPPPSTLQGNNTARNGPVMGHGHVREKTFDLCRKCANEFNAWVNQ